MVFVLFPSSKLPENRSIPAVTKGLKSGDRIGRAQYDGRSKIERNEIFFMTVMVAERIGASASRILYTVRGSGIGKSHPFVRSAPSFRPDLRTMSAVARSGAQGWPLFGPPLQRRAASLTAASTAARSVASGSPSAPIEPSKNPQATPSKTKITLT